MPEGIQTSHGLAGFIGLMVLVVLAFHFIGFRVIFAAGRPA